jgi:hypothetical protein
VKEAQNLSAASLDASPDWAIVAGNDFVFTADKIDGRKIFGNSKTRRSG